MNTLVNMLSVNVIEMGVRVGKENDIKALNFFTKFADSIFCIFVRRKKYKKKCFESYLKIWHFNVNGQNLKCFDPTFSAIQEGR